MEKSLFLEVRNAEHLRDFQLLIEFNDGKTLIVDLENRLEGKVFEPLKNMDFFKKFQIRYNTIEWPNGADFAPEYLYEIGIPPQKELLTKTA